MILQPRPPKEDRPTAFSTLETLTSFVIAGLLLAILAAYVDGSMGSAFQVLDTFVTIYCALCLAELIKVVRDGSV